MTLIITAVDNDRVVQVSDRRLTDPNGEVHDHGANKAVCIGMGYVHFATSYTGLAYIGGRAREDHRTDYWLLENLGEITRDGEPSLEEICSAISERAASALARLPSNVRRVPLTFVMAGYDRENRPFRATVTNTRMVSGMMATRDRFISDVRRVYPWDRRPDIHIAGAVAVFEAKDKHARALAELRTIVVKHMKRHGDRLDDMQVARYLVSLVRAATTHPQFGHLIGRDCLSVMAFPRKPGMLGAVTTSIDQSGPRPDTPFRSHYHPVSASTILYGPLLADPYIDVLSSELDLDPDPPGVDREEAANQRLQRIADYYATFYGELRRRLPASGIDQDKIPRFLRGHSRRIVIAECQNGYAVQHYADENFNDARGMDEMEVEDTFLYETGYKGQPVEELTGTGPHRSTAYYEVYVAHEGQGVPWERQDVMGKATVRHLTEEEARKEVDEVLARLREESPSG